MKLTKITYFGAARKTITASIQPPKKVTMTNKIPSLMQQYRAIQHHHPLAKSTSATSPPKIPTDYANNPAMLMGNQ
jgi:hypothetical protein